MINFSDSQIQSISSDILKFPTTLAALQSSLVGINAAQANFLKKDADKIAFQNHFINVITQFHWELGNANGQLRTNYNVANIDLTAKSTPGNIHYPVGWSFMYPKVDPSNNGQPVSSITNEFAQILSFTSRSALMVNGFGTGVSGTTTSSALTTNQVTIGDATAFGVGSTIAIYNGSDCCAGTVSNQSGNTVTINFQVAPNGPIAAGATVMNVFPAFSNADRQALPGTLEFASIRSSLDTNSTILKQCVSNQLDALKINDSGDASNTTALANVNAILNSINNWQNGSSGGTSGRYCDAVLNPFLNTLGDRQGQITSRATDIGNLLGNVANTGSDGSYTGVGYYLELFKWIDARCGVMAGTLRGYYNSSLSLSAINTQINSAQQNNASYTAQLAVSAFKEDATGTNKVIVASASTFLGYSTAKIVGDNQPVLAVNITGISLTENSLTFDTIIGAQYTKAVNSRVVVQKQ